MTDELSEVRAMLSEAIAKIDAITANHDLAVEKFVSDGEEYKVGEIVYFTESAINYSSCFFEGRHAIVKKIHRGYIEVELTDVKYPQVVPIDCGCFRKPWVNL